MDRQPAYRLLPWDSAFFGRRIARLARDTLDEAYLDEIRSGARRDGVDCFYFLARADDPATHRLAAAARFRFVDVRVELERPLAAAELTAAEVRPPDLVRALRASDVDRLAAIARASHTDSRFYSDPGFPEERCADLYATWLRQDCEGAADRVHVAAAAAGPSGYLTCHLDGASDGRIGLFAVDRDARGQGLGRALVEASLRWFAEQGRTRVTVVTQERNRQAQRIYQRNGFVTFRSRRWYHFWPADTDDERLTIAGSRR